MTEPSDPIAPTPPEPAEPEAPAPTSDEGRLIDGRYRLAEVIGTGGMATVHRAFDTRLDRPVAVKLLRREAVADPDIAMRFRREALAATVLRHPNIVACLETGTDDGQPYLVMELIEGEDLAARLRRGGRLAPAEAEKIGLDVARALGVAHVRGIVHRDVKPGNILLARDGRAMVTDFGIARLAADTEGAVPGTTLGSVHYFSPEQAKGETTTAASDVYSLGLVLYEALTGQRAWSGDSTVQLAAARIDAAAPSPRAVRPEVPAALDAIVVRALDPDPAKRFPNGNAMAEALEPLVAYPDAASLTVATETAPIVAAAAPATPVLPAAPLVPELSAVAGPAVRTKRSRRTPAAIAAPLAVLLIVAAVVGGALVVAMLPAGGDRGTALASGSPRPSRTPLATDRPTATPRPTVRPSATPRRTPSVAPAPTAQPTPRPPGAAADLCEPVLRPRAISGPAPMNLAFKPPIRFVLGDGWSASLVDPDIVALGRDAGIVTIAVRVATSTRRERTARPPRRPRPATSSPRSSATPRVTGRRARRRSGSPGERRRSFDLSPSGGRSGGPLRSVGSDLLPRNSGNDQGLRRRRTLGPGRHHRRAVGRLGPRGHPAGRERGHRQPRFR